MLVDRDQANRLGRGGVAQARHDPRAGQAHATLGPGALGFDQLAILGAVHICRADDPLLVCTLVDGHDAPALGALAEDAQHALRVGADTADQAAFVLVIFALYLTQARQDAVILFQRRVACLLDQ